MLICQSLVLQTELDGSTSKSRKSAGYELFGKTSILLLNSPYWMTKKHTTLFCLSISPSYSILYNIIISWCLIIYNFYRGVQIDFELLFKEN